MGDRKHAVEEDRGQSGDSEHSPVDDSGGYGHASARCTRANPPASQIAKAAATTSTAGTDWAPSTKPAALADAVDTMSAAMKAVAAGRAVRGRLANTATEATAAANATQT